MTVHSVSHWGKYGMLKKYKQKLSFNRTLSRIRSKGCKTPPGPSPSSLRHKDNLQQHNLLRKETGFPPGLLQRVSEFMLWYWDIRGKVRGRDAIHYLAVDTLLKYLYSWNSFFLACSSLALMYSCTVLENQDKHHLPAGQQEPQQDYLSNYPALSFSKQRWQTWRPDRESWGADSCSVCLYNAWHEAWVFQVSISHTAYIRPVSQYALWASKILGTELGKYRTVRRWPNLYYTSLWQLSFSFKSLRYRFMQNPTCTLLAFTRKQK